MKTLALLALSVTSSITFMGCFGVDTNAGDDVSSACVGDHCVCPTSTSCIHTCAPGAAECHVQGSSPAVDITCNNNAECHVECAGSQSCDVDCGGSTECHVTCPASGCTVSSCVGEACVVTCGALGEAARNGSTATCP